MSVAPNHSRLVDTNEVSNDDEDVDDDDTDDVPPIDTLELNK